MPGSWSDFLKLRSGPAPPPSSEAGAVRVYADADGALRSIQPDGTDAPIGGGGGSTPTTREDFGAGHLVTIPNGQSRRLEWDLSFGPDTILDLTTPDQPVIAVAGIYAVSVGVGSNTAMTVGGYYTLMVEFDAFGEDADVEVDSRAATAAAPYPLLASYGVFYFPAGGVLQVSVRNHDGTQDLDCKINTAFVQRIT